MKILIVSGFLGAGKTTFIKTLAARTGKEFAILENEYGAAGIDGDILRQNVQEADVNVWEMTEGCICCSAKGDFAASVLTIANSVDPDYLVIEPTGVGMLGNVVRNLQKIQYERITLLAPVTIVDGNSFLRYSREYPVLYQEQIASASAVFVSKMENAQAEEKEVLRRELEKINPGGVLMTEHYSSLKKEQWEELLSRGYDGRILRDPSAESETLPDSFSLKGAAMDCPERLFFLLEQLIRGCYGNIFRAKGSLPAGKQVLRFDVADGRYLVTGEESCAEGKAVFIGTELQRQKLREQFMIRADRVKIRPSSGRSF